MEAGSELVIPLTSVLVWAEAYGVIALIVWLGFIVQRYGWGEPEEPLNPVVRGLRVWASGLIVAALWPLWAAIGAFVICVAAI